VPRGFVWALYFDDLAAQWRLQVDADSVLELERGWVPADTATTFPLPRGWLPRKVSGPDETGRLRQAVVASVLADLWTGAATQFTVEGSDGQPHTCTVTRLLGERRDAAS
jgi:hypothetical protein